jgi:hypothetical protein
MKSLDKTEPAEMPAENVGLRLCEILVEAYIVCRPREEGLAYLECIARIASEREEMRHVVQIRRSDKMSARAVAERQTLAALRDMLEVWMARLRN